jgi:hypothetical protein
MLDSFKVQEYAWWHGLLESMQESVLNSIQETMLDSVQEIVLDSLDEILLDSMHQRMLNSRRICGGGWSLLDRMRENMIDMRVCWRA